MDFADLSKEMQEKAKAASSPQEILDLAKEEGYELTDDQLEDIAGGAWKPWKDGVGA